VLKEVDVLSNVPRGRRSVDLRPAKVCDLDSLGVIFPSSSDMAAIYVETGRDMRIAPST